MNDESITVQKLKELGFKDTTGGWGGSQGEDYHYEKDGFEIQTYDSDDNWHIENNFNIKFKTVKELKALFKFKMGYDL